MSSTSRLTTGAFDYLETLVAVGTELAPLSGGYLVAFHWGFIDTASGVERVLDRVVERPDQHRPGEN